MVRIFKFLLLVLVTGVSSAAVTAMFHMGTGLTPISGNDIGYVDFITISLTALSLMITILGFFIAAAGVIGWATLENKLREHSVSYFKAQLSENGELRNEFEKLIIKITHSGIGDYLERANGEGANRQEGEQEYND